MESTRLSDYDYELPPEAIAQEPAARRDRSQMMVLQRRQGVVAHEIFTAFPDYLAPGDLLVMNNTRVIPARLLGRRLRDGGEAELLLLHHLAGEEWLAMVRPGRKLKPGAAVLFEGGLQAQIEEYAGRGQRRVRFSGPEPLEKMLPHLGRVPLPPYITQELKDPAQYQTIYAAASGSSAAPTAGFHFTPEIFEELRRKKISWTFATLHIGPGTFQPVREEDIRSHKMHREYYRLGAAAAAQINETRERGGRICAVGTTACRILETAADAGGSVKEQKGWTDLFIHPGYRFKAVDLLLTNFHLPRSTLLMLVSAFAGRQTVLEAYRLAVQENYRFYSFGDSMLLL